MCKFSTQIHSKFCANYYLGLQIMYIRYPSDRWIEKFSCKILQEKAYGFHLLARFLQVFRFTCKTRVNSLASLILLQDSCNFFNSFARFLQACKFFNSVTWLQGATGRAENERNSWYCIGNFSRVKLENRLLRFSRKFWVCSPPPFSSGLGTGYGGVTNKQL